MSEERFAGPEAHLANVALMSEVHGMSLGLMHGVDAVVIEALGGGLGKGDTGRRKEELIRKGSLSPEKVYSYPRVSAGNQI